LAFDAFISYASQDKPVADAVCARLEAAGIRCWIAPRDITPGMSYGEAIINAIHTARVMILVFSSHANASPQVPKEIERAVSNNVPIIPYRIENVTPGASLDYFIGSVHWLDALTPPMEQHLDSLVSTVRKLVQPRGGDDPPRPGPTPAPVPQPVPPPPAPQPIPPQPPRRKNTPPVIGLVLIVAVAAFGIYRWTSRSPDNGGGSADKGSNIVQPAPDSSPAPSAPDNSKHPTPASEPSHASGDPVAGCYAWFSGQTIVFHPNGTVVAGPITGHWAHTAGATYQITWPITNFIVTTIGNGDTSLTMSNQYGVSLTGQRTGVGIGLAGKWALSNGGSMDVGMEGTFTAGPYSGTWRGTDQSGKHYEMKWPAPVDSLQLIGGTRLQGINNYSIPISGTRTACPR
jgi:hypothetical protein